MKPLDFDRAFPKTPDCIHAAIEMGIRKGQQKMKLRYKIISLASVAAMLAIVIAAVALASGIGAPKPDVLTQPAARDRSLKNDEAVVYFTTNGVYYHSEEHCSGMMNAQAHSLSEAYASGKKPCPICIAEAGEEEPTVYATTAGKYYHSEEHCSGMMNSQAYSLSEVEAMGKSACPVCIEEWDEIVYAVNIGALYYHSAPVCNGQKNDRAISLSEAESKNLKPCPKCCQWTEENTKPERYSSTQLTSQSSANLSATALSQADQKATELHSLLFRIAFGDLEKTASASGYAFRTGTREGRYVLSKKLGSVSTWALYSDLSRTNDSYRLDVHLDSTARGTEYVMKNATAQPIKGMYPKAVEITKAYSNEDPEYVERIQVGFDSAMQVSSCEIEFRTSKDVLSVCFYPTGDSENPWTAACVPYAKNAL